MAVCRKRVSPVATCENRSPEESPSGFAMFLPVFSAQVSAENPKATYKGRCFEEITFELQEGLEASFEILVTTVKPKTKLCQAFAFCRKMKQDI